MMFYQRKNYLYYVKKFKLGQEELGVKEESNGVTNNHSKPQNQTGNALFTAFKKSESYFDTPGFLTQQAILSEVPFL